MHALLLTLIAIAGADGCGCAPAEGACACQSACACEGGCNACDSGRVSMSAKMQAKRIAKPPCGSVFGMMPQTCYDPPYGCYPGTRYTNRYPAFHGSYYRTAYNYRTYFDYPWHAEMHEPTSLFSYNTEESVPTRAPLPAHAKNAAGPNNNYAATPFARHSTIAAKPVSTGPNMTGSGIMRR